MTPSPEILSSTADDSAPRFFGPAAGRHVSEMRRALRYAERRLYSLRDLSDDPSTAQWVVEMELAEFLTWARQVRTSINDAVRAACDARASTWWSELDSDAELRAFTARRNRALKRVQPASEKRCIDLDIDGVPHSVTYFMFADDPYPGDPIFPRCQKHFARIRDLTEQVQMLLPRAP